MRILLSNSFLVDQILLGLVFLGIGDLFPPLPICFLLSLFGDGEEVGEFGFSMVTLMKIRATTTALPTSLA